MYITYNNVVYILGGWWQTNPSKKAEKKLSRQAVVKEYKELLNIQTSESIDYDCFLRVPGQFAFFKREDSSKRQYSLAYCAAVKKPDITAIIEIEGKYWVLCARDGMVLPEGDNLFLNLQTAKEHCFDNGFINTEDELVIVSDYKDYFSALGVSPACLLEDIQYNIFNVRNILIGTAAVFCIGIYGWFSYLDASEREEVAKLNLIQNQETMRQVADAKAHPERYFDKVFETYSPVSNKEFLLNVSKDIKTLREFVNGWQVSRVSYTKDRRLTRWAGNGEYLALPENGTLGKNGVSSVKRFVYLESSDNHVRDLNNKDEIGRYLFSLTKNSATALSVTWNAPLRKVVKIGTEEVELYEPWETGTLVINNVTYNLLSDSNFNNLLSVYGLVIEEVVYENGHFSLRGKIFVRK